MNGKKSSYSKSRQMIFVLILAFVLSMTWGISVSAKENADKVYSDGYYNYHLGDKFISICGYFGKEEVVTIPSSIITYPVSRIESGTFKGCDTVKKIILPDTIMEIEDGAFSGAKHLNSVKDYAGNEIWNLDTQQTDKTEETVNHQNKTDGNGQNTDKNSDSKHAAEQSNNDGNTIKDNSQDNNSTSKDNSKNTGNTVKDNSQDNNSTAKDNSQDNIGQAEYVEPDEPKEAEQENQKNREQIAAILANQHTVSNVKDSAGNTVTVDDKGNLVVRSSDGAEEILDDTHKYTQNTDGSIENEDGEKITLDKNDKVVLADNGAEGQAEEKQKKSGFWIPMVLCLTVVAAGAVFALFRKKKGKKAE